MDSEMKMYNKMKKKKIWKSKWRLLDWIWNVTLHISHSNSPFPQSSTL